MKLTPQPSAEHNTKTILLKSFFHKNIRNQTLNSNIHNPIRWGHLLENKSSIKSQSAMEYLTTYGWAILIIAIVMAALFSLGVFNPYTFSPKASPGSCQVVRSGGYIALIGTCTGQIPQSVASFPYYAGAVNKGYSPIYVSDIGQSTMSTITITWWVKPTSTSTLGALWGLYVTNGAGGFSSNIYGSKVPYDIWIYPPTSLKDNIWSFESVTLSSSNVAIKYLNGNPGTPATWNGPLTGITSFSMLGFAPNQAWWFNGSMANVQIYNTSLSSADIQALYKEGIGGAPININNLVGWWPLNGNGKDYSGNGNDAVVNENVTFKSNWYNGYTAP